MAELTQSLGSKYRRSTPTTAGELTQNLGGKSNKINGVTYLGKKATSGTVSVLTGALNLIQGGWLQLTGNTYQAEKIYATRDANALSKEADEQYNANGFMRFTGSVAEGIGQFLPAAVLGAVTGGSSAAVGAAQGLAYTGMNVQEAYQKTGNLGGREYLYGAILGSFEGAMDAITGGLGGWIKGSKVANVAAKAGKATTSAAASAGKLALKNTVGNVIKGGSSEFAEEFIESYAEVFLQKALQIDPNAQYSLQDALYAGAVGFASGGLMSGASSALNTMGMQKTGKRVMDAGETDMTIAAATEIASAFQSNGKIEENALQTLKDNLALWEKTADKTGTQAQMLLGNIRLAMSVCENYAGQAGTIRTVTSNPEKFLPYAKAIFGDQITAEDLRSPDSQAVRYIAAMQWATGEVGKLTLKANKAKMQERVNAVNEGRENAVDVSEANWQGGDAVYSTGDGSFVFVVSGKHGYTVMYGADTDNVQAFPAKDDSNVLTEDEVRAALAQVAEASKRAKAEGERAATETKQSLGEDAEDGIGGYSENEKASICKNKNYSVAESFEDVLAFVQSSLASSESKFLFVGKIGQEAVTMIQKSVGLDVKGTSLVLSSSDIRHIFKHHGSEKSESNRGQVAVTEQNIDKIIQTVLQPDAVETTTDKSGTVSLILKKEINGEVTAVTVLSQKKKALTLKSAWIKKEGQHISSPRNVQALRQTPEANGSMNAVPTDSIPENGENVNSTTKNSLADGEEAAVDTKEVPATETKTARATAEKTVLTDKVKRDRERLLADYGAEVQDRARKLVKGIDRLSAERRIAIYETILSGGNIDDATLCAACVFESGRKGLVLYFNRKLNPSKKGFWATFKDGDVRMVAVAEGAEGVRATVAHEVFHDIRSTGAGKVLEAYALEIGDVDAMIKCAEKYGNHFAKRYNIESFADFIKANRYKTAAEAIAAYDEKHKNALCSNALAEEVAASVIGDKLGTERFMQRVGGKRGGIKAVLRSLGRMKAFLQDRTSGEYLAEVRRLEKLYLIAAKEAQLREQIAEVTASKASLATTDSRFALSDVDDTPETRYNNYGWVRENDVLTSGAWQDFTSKFAAAVSGHGKPPKTKGGEFMIAVNDPHNEGVNKYIVYAGGTIESPVISRVLEIDLDNETELDEKRREIYAAERRGIQQTAGGLCHLYSATNFRHQRYEQRKGSQNVDHHNQLGVQRGRSSATSDRIKEFKVNDDGSYTTVYTDGREETKFSLSDDVTDTAARESAGLTAKRKADATRRWVYDKKDAREIVHRLLADDEYNADGFTLKLSGKSEEQIVDYLWRVLNEGKATDIDACFDAIADFMVTNTLMEYTELTYAEEERLEQAKATYQALAYYRKKLDLTSLKEEIIYKYGKDGAKRIFSRWHKKGGLQVDAVATEIDEVLASCDSGVSVAANHPSETLSAIVEAFDKACAGMEEAYSISAMAQFSSAEELERFKQAVKKKLAEGMQGKGKDSTLTKNKRAFREHYEGTIDKIMKRYRKQQRDLEAATKKQNIYASAILAARELSEMVKTRKHVNAAALIAPEMRTVAEMLSKVANLRGVKEPGVREAMKLLDAWYTAENIVPDFLDENGKPIETSIYLENVKAMISAIAKGNGLLSPAEVRDLGNILRHVKKIYTDYDKMKLNGKNVSIEKSASDELRMLGAYVKWDEKRQGKFLAFWHKVRNGYLFGALTPKQVIQSIEFYDQKAGILQKLYTDVQNGLASANSDYADLMKPVVEFLEKNKKYDKHLSKDRLDYFGASMTYGQAISLYLTTYRAQARLALEETGISFMGADGRVHQMGGRKIDDIRTELRGRFTDQDKEYIKIIEKMFVRAGKMKVDADTAIFGFTNIEDGYYYPIIRDEMGRARKTADIRQTMREMAVVANKSFNQNICEGAKGRLFIADVTDIANTHAKGVAQYANLYTPLQSWDKVWNKAIVAEDGTKRTVREIVNDRIWTKKGERGQADKYFSKLFADIQGVGTPYEIGDKIYAELRSSYVAAALGLNLSSMLKQWGSFGTAQLYLGTQDLMKAFTVKSDDQQMRKYSKVANGRLFDRSRVVDAETNVAEGQLHSGLQKVRNTVTAPVEWMDAQVVRRLWAACQLNVERTQGFAVGSEENLAEAGKLLDKVINDTQSTSTTDTRSAYQRGGKIAQAFTMFTSDAVKTISYIYEAGMRGYMARQRVKMGIGTEADVKEANTFAKRAAIAFLSQTAITVLIIQLIKWIRAEEREEDESLAADVAGEVAGQVISILPFVSDIYDLVAHNYEINSFVFDSVNDLAQSTTSLWKVVSNVARGKSVTEKEVAGAIKNNVVALGGIFGIPARNVHNYATGLMKRVAPVATYGYTSLFSGSSYAADLDKAVANGNERLAARVLEILVKRKQTGGTISSTAVSEMLYLYQQTGEDGNPLNVLGGDLPYTYDGRELTASERKQMRTIYAKADKVVEQVVKSDFYEDLTDEERAKAIRNTYSTYLAKAKSDVLGAKATPMTLMVDLIDPSLLMAVFGKISLLESDDNTAKSEKVAQYLNSLDLTNDERYVILFAAGYRSKAVKGAITKIAKKSNMRSEDITKILDLAA